MAMKRNYGPKNRLLWDCWFFQKGGKIHVFYLQAEPSNDPGKKHGERVSIGHAVTENLIDYEELPAALEPGFGDAWDGLALWTGSVIGYEGRHYMFYTGRRNNERERWIQRIGVAVSDDDDLISWKKYGNNPVLEARGRYGMDNERNALGRLGAWRDPFAFRDPESGKHFMTISARLKGERKEYNGCVAIARMADPISWDLMFPIFAPGVYDEIECTQVIFFQGNYYLFFSTWAENYEPEFAKKAGARSGLHCYYSKNLFKGYKPVNGNGVVLDNGNEMYGVRLLQTDNASEFNAVGWLRTKEGKYAGVLSDPFRIRIEKGRVFKI